MRSTRLENVNNGLDGLVSPTPDLLSETRTLGIKIYLMTITQNYSVINWIVKYEIVNNKELRINR